MIYKTINEFLEKYIDNEIDDSLVQLSLRKKIPEVKTYFIMLYINSGNNALYNVLGGYIKKEDGFKFLLNSTYNLFKEDKLTNEDAARDLITKSIINDSFLKKFVEESKLVLKSIIAIFFSGLYENTKEYNWIISTRKSIIEVDVSKYKELINTSISKNLLKEGITLCEELIVIREESDGKLQKNMIETYLLLAGEHKKINDTFAEMSNYKKIIEISEKIGKTDVDYMIDVYHRVGEVCEAKKDLDEAKKNYDKWVNCIKNIKGDNDLDVGRALKVKARIFEENGEIAKALETLYVAEKIFLSNLPLDDKETIDLYDKIFQLELIAENYEILLDLAEKVYSEAVNQNATRNPKAIEVKISRGEICKELGDFETMEEAFFESLKSIKEIFGERHYLEGRILICRGDIELDNNNFLEAERLYKLAMDYIGESLGKNHIQALNCNNKLGEMYEKMKDYESAAFYYDKYINLREAEVTPDTIDVLNQKQKLSNAKRLLGETKEAKEMLESILEIKENKFSKNHYELISIYKKIGLIYIDFDKNEKSREYLEKGLKIAKGIYQPNNKKVIFLEEKLGLVNGLLKNYDTSIMYYKTALDKQYELDNKLEIARFHKNLCELYIETENIEEAQEHIKKAMEVTENEVGRESLLMLECLNLGSEIDFLLKNHSSALKKLKEIENILKTNFGTKNHNLAIVYQNIAKIKLAQGNANGVRGMLDEALKININKYGKKSSIVAENYGNLAIYNYMQNNKKNALMNFEKALEINESIDKEINYMTKEMYLALGDLYNDSEEIDKALLYLTIAVKREEYLSNEGDNETKINELLDKVYNFEKQEEYVEAKNVFIDFIETKVKFKGKESLGDGKIYRKITNVLLKANNLDFAELYANKRMLVKRCTAPEFSVSLVDNYMEIAKIQRDKGDYKGATDILENVAYIIKKNSEKDSTKIGKIQCEIGIINRSMGEINVAIDNLERAVEIFEKIDEINSIPCWNALNEIGDCYIDVGEPYDALKYYQRCKEICENGSDIDDKYKLITYKKLGKIYFCLEDYDNAKNYFSNALEISQKINGENSIVTGALYTDIGLVLKKNKDYNIAKKYFGDAKVSYKNSIGEKHNNYKYLLAVISENDLNFKEQKERNSSIIKNIFKIIKGN